MERNLFAELFGALQSIFDAAPEVLLQSWPGHCFLSSSAIMLTNLVPLQNASGRAPEANHLEKPEKGPGSNALADIVALDEPMRTPSSEGSRSASRHHHVPSAEQVERAFSSAGRHQQLQNKQISSPIQRNSTGAGVPLPCSLATSPIARVTSSEFKRRESGRPRVEDEQPIIRTPGQVGHIVCQLRPVSLSDACPTPHA